MTTSTGAYNGLFQANRSEASGISLEKNKKIKLKHKQNTDVDDNH